MHKYGLNIEYFSARSVGPQYVAPILIDAANDAETERQAEAVANFAMSAAMLHQIKVTITREPSRQVVNTIQRP